jgi:carbamate kinase
VGGHRKSPRRMQPPPLVLALGGNSISRRDDEPSVGAQFERARETCELLVPLIASAKWRVVITHGNGPQVGNILLRSDLAAEAGELPRIPVDAAVADTQGAMGYMLQQSLAGALWESGLRVPVVTVVTQVIVDEDDPAFAAPAKPIGRFYPPGAVAALERHGWVMTEQDGGWRRVVPSPMPREIVEEDVVGELLDAGVVVIACGGGGIPVVMSESGRLRGVEAVVDKDHASSLLASHVGAPVFVMLTDVDRIAVDRGTDRERRLDEVDVDELAAYEQQGHFPAGSMGPKVRAAIDFVARGGARAIVTAPERVEDALAGRAGTHVVASRAEAAATR